VQHEHEGHRLRRVDAAGDALEHGEAWHAQLQVRRRDGQGGDNGDHWALTGV